MHGDSGGNTAIQEGHAANYLLSGTGVTRVYRGRGGRRVRALDDVTIGVRPGESLAIVGESGSGKSTLARILSYVEAPTSGQVSLGDSPVTRFASQARGPIRRRVQLIFQDAKGSLDPRFTIARTMREAARVHGLDDSDDAIARALHSVGLRHSEVHDRVPEHLSGGQCQRICIARALLLQPDVLVCDEVVSALDVSVQAQIIGLLRSIMAERRMAMIFVTHDLLVAREIGDQICVMYGGRVCETGPIEEVLSSPVHPYTRQLFGSLLDPLSRAGTGTAEPNRTPDAIDDPAAAAHGCPYYPRCPIHVDQCRDDPPVLRASGTGGLVACFESPSPGGTTQDTKEVF